MKKLFTFLAVCLFVLVASMCYACYSSISGTVTDSLTGAPIAGATIRIHAVNGNEKAKAVSDSNGYYSKDILAGTYQATAFANGYDSLKYGVPIVLVVGVPTSGVDFKMIKHCTDVGDEGNITLPNKMSLSQNYPNPFNPKTMIRFALPKDSWVKLEVYNVLGQKIRTLVDAEMMPGSYQVVWDGKDNNGQKASSGIYFYKIVAGDFVQAKEMVLLK